MDNYDMMRLAKGIFKIGLVAVPAIVLHVKSKKRDKALDTFYDCYQNEDYDTALWHINKYIENNEKDNEGHLWKGTVLNELKSYEEAVLSLEKSVAIKDDVYEAQKIMADCLMELGRYREAVNHYDKAVKLDKKRLPARFNRGIAYMNLEDYKKAIEDFHHVEKKEDGDKTYIYEELSAAYLLDDNQLQHIKYASLVEGY